MQDDRPRKVTKALFRYNLNRRSCFPSGENLIINKQHALGTS